MNQLLPQQFVEHIDRLMLGVEPLDAQRGSRIARPIDLTLDGVPNPSFAPAAAQTWDSVMGFPDAIGSLTAIPRHNSCRYALTFRPGMNGPVVIRLFDRQRRFVPRRISYPVPADIGTTTSRTRRPALYPGAAYDFSSTTTGLRGRVTWNQPATNEVAARWVRVVATIGDTVVGHAHGDDRGEFLLLLDNSAGTLSDLSSPLDVQVTVYGASPQPTLPANDPLGDLPVEILAVDPDDVSPGDLLPPGYVSTASSSRTVSFQIGSLLTNQDKFFFNP